MRNLLDAYDTIGLTITANDDEIVGRTTLQKLIYFVDVKIPEIRLEPYFAYYYGPFNRQVAKELERMVVFELLEERRAGDNFGSYLYRVTNKGIPVINNLRRKFRRTLTKIENIVDQCQTFCKLDPNSLSFASKVHFMVANRKAQQSLTYDNLTDMSIKFGWKISKSDVEQGAELLQQLNLVKIRR